MNPLFCSKITLIQCNPMRRQGGHNRSKSLILVAQDLPIVYIAAIWLAVVAAGERAVSAADLRSHDNETDDDDECDAAAHGEEDPTRLVVVVDHLAIARRARVAVLAARTTERVQ